MLTSEQRRLRAKKAANTRWAFEDREAWADRQRQAIYDRFDAMIPASITDPIERDERAAQLRRAYFQGLALKSSRARARSKGTVDAAA